MSLGDRITELVRKGYVIKFDRFQTIRTTNIEDCDRFILRLGKDGYDYSKMVNLQLSEKFEGITEESVILMALDELVVMLNERIGK